ncbi:hypothetical protein ACIBCR_15615 [Micromonospora echinospora]|uniref:hypothetical protein n=1 Tax=Micromonospora echinospora TaxID=1877 RepID=UPI003787D65B
MTDTLTAHDMAASLVHRATRWLNTTNGTSQQELILRILKVAEEVGEVCETIESQGTRRDDTVRELVDVIVTAMTAQASLGHEPYGLDRLDPVWHRPGQLPHAAVILSAETGRLAAAVIGWTGQNPRKGQTHTVEQVCNQLANVVPQAAAMISMCGVDPADAIRDGVAKFHDRLDALGVGQ